MSRRCCRKWLPRYCSMVTSYNLPDKYWSILDRIAHWQILPWITLIGCQATIIPFRKKNMCYLHSFVYTLFRVYFPVVSISGLKAHLQQHSSIYSDNAVHWWYHMSVDTHLGFCVFPFGCDIYTLLRYCVIAINMLLVSWSWITRYRYYQITYCKTEPFITRLYAVL